MEQLCDGLPLSGTTEGKAAPALNVSPLVSLLRNVSDERKEAETEARPFPGPSGRHEAPPGITKTRYYLRNHLWLSMCEWFGFPLVSFIFSSYLLGDSSHDALCFWADAAQRPERRANALKKRGNALNAIRLRRFRRREKIFIFWCQANTCLHSRSASGGSHVGLTKYTHLPVRESQQWFR